MKRSNGEINMKITGNYLKITLELFHKKPKAANHKKIMGNEENECQSNEVGFFNRIK